MIFVPGLFLSNRFRLSALSNAEKDACVDGEYEKIKSQIDLLRRNGAGENTGKIRQECYDYFLAIVRDVAQPDAVRVNALYSVYNLININLNAEHNIDLNRVEETGRMQYTLRHPFSILSVPSAFVPCDEILPGRDEGYNVYLSMRLKEFCRAERVIPYVLAKIPAEKIGAVLPSDNLSDVCAFAQSLGFENFALLLIAGQRKDPPCGLSRGGPVGVR